MVVSVFYGHLLRAQNKDTVSVLKPVQVAAVKKPNNYNNISPVQVFGRENLLQMNAPSVGDAARYFSGVLVKDYGGSGGLKTISVRSLGASATGVVYDGIPVADLQSGQVDLGRYSTSFVQSLELLQGSIQHSLMPARTYASAAALAISSNTFNTRNFQQQNWQAGIRAGSFNTWQPFAGLYQPLKKNTVFSVNAEALYSKGNYPIQTDNGNISEKTTRNNAAIKSIQGEANLLKQFADSSSLQVKTGVYSAERGLPGAIVFFNERSAQGLQNTDFFLQGRYQKKIKQNSAVLLSAKYSHTYTRYTDPDFLNNQGGLDDRYTQQEVYFSAAASHQFFHRLRFSAASDIAINTLRANQSNFASPSRTSYWEHAGLHYVQSGWQFDASLLYTGIHDKTVFSTAAVNRNKLTPALAISFTPAAASPFMFRVFYKSVYRMPTFNDLYYNFIGNSTLRPEFSRQYNAGITYTKQFNKAIKKFSISIDAYYNEVKDKIVAVPSQNLFVWTMLNIGKVSIKGLDVNTEAAGKFSAAIGWFVRIAYTWQQALDISDASASTYKNRIPYTPDHSGSALASFSYKKWEAGYNALFAGARFSLGENNPANQLAGWLTQDVFLARSLPLKKCNLHIKAALNNITGERYDIVRYYPMPGRSFTISLFINHL